MVIIIAQRHDADSMVSEVSFPFYSRKTCRLCESLILSADDTKLLIPSMNCMLYKPTGHKKLGDRIFSKSLAWNEIC